MSSTVIEGNASREGNTLVLLNLLVRGFGDVLNEFITIGADFHYTLSRLDELQHRNHDTVRDVRCGLILFYNHIIGYFEILFHFFFRDVHVYVVPCAGIRE